MQIIKKIWSPFCEIVEDPNALVQVRSPEQVRWLLRASPGLSVEILFCSPLDSLASCLKKDQQPDIKNYIKGWIDFHTKIVDLSSEFRARVILRDISVHVRPAEDALSKLANQHTRLGLLSFLLKHSDVEDIYVALLEKVQVDPSDSPQPYFSFRQQYEGLLEEYESHNLERVLDISRAVSRQVKRDARKEEERLFIDILLERLQIDQRSRAHVLSPSPLTIRLAREHRLQSRTLK